MRATGLPFIYGEPGDGRAPFHPSLDRIDDARGYERGAENVRVVLTGFNLMRGDLDDDTFHDIIAAYVARTPKLAERIARDWEDGAFIRYRLARLATSGNFSRTSLCR
jgi:hypothetical protein